MEDNIFQFDEPQVEFPEKTILNLTNGFDTATDGLASLILLQIKNDSRIGGINSTFQFRLKLISNILINYSFTLLDFGYDVTIYPVTITIDDSEIANELGITETDFYDNYIVTLNSDKELISLLKSIFQTNTFRKTVGGLMKIAREKANNSITKT
ncbi:hypothetical protein [uncultured Tolumonas sp.]|uniref:hypothetical protein n=1 Tax=uncultured Tolumonas sp. TaxID=263765 RepID=UPI002A0A3AD3|nr:hypothetical protein [uncultured Tolumonas sp.]